MAMSCIIGLVSPLHTDVKMGVRLPSDGPVAQLGARLNGIQEVTGSIPVRSTKPSFPVWISRKSLKAGALFEQGRAPPIGHANTAAAKVHWTRIMLGL